MINKFRRNQEFGKQIERITTRIERKIVRKYFKIYKSQISSHKIAVKGLKSLVYKKLAYASIADSQSSLSSKYAFGI